jgi:hypothetical protein
MLNTICGSKMTSIPRGILNGFILRSFIGTLKVSFISDNFDYVEQKIQFNILNLAKPQSLYSLGMKICVKSSKKNNNQWFRGCEDNVKYF